MKKNYFTSIKICAAMAVVLLLGVNGLKAQLTQTFSFSGGVQSFTVPSCVGTISLDVRGAQGAANINGVLGGLGGSASGVLTVNAGDVLNFYVGGMNGYNGGGNAGVSACTSAMGANGGGASDVRLNGTTLASRVIVAAGGGGAGGDRSNGCGRGTGGGGGGGYYGGGGGCGYPSSSLVVPTGGTQTSGGAGGVSGYLTSQNGLNGGLGIGGDGGTETSSSQGGANTAYPGGVGGGLTGASGQQPPSNIFTGQSGAGGSSYLGTLTNSVTTSGTRSGNGIIIMSYTFNGPGILAGSSSSVICTGSTATLTASNVVSYTWSPGGATSASIAVSPTATTIYTAQGTNSIGCVSTLTLGVNVNTAVPTLTIANSSAATSTAVCSGKTVTLTASGALTYTWTNGVTNGLTYTPTATSNYTVTGANACGNSTAITSVTVNPLPPVTASINNPTVCTGGSVTLNGGGAVSYTWSGGYSNNVAFAPPASNGYTVTGTAANNCTATAVTGVTVFITPNTPPVVTPTAVCVGSSATLSSTGATGYTWTPGSALNTSSISVSPPSTTTYTLFRVNGACSSTSTITLVINPNPVMSAGGTPGTICAGASVSLTAFGAITYSWAPGGFTAASLVLYPNFSTNYVVTGSNGNCTTTMTVPVVVNPSPTISVVSTPSICSGGTAQLSASGNAATYTWSAGPPNTTAISVTPAATTIYTITGTNSFNCTASQNALVVVYQTPSSTLSTSSNYVCAGQSATIGAVNASGVSYLWNTGAITPSIVVNPTITTSYTLTATDLASNCQGSNNITLAVYISTFSVASPTAVCKGSTATFTASGAATSYSWSSNAGGVTTATAAVSPTVSQVYSVAGITGSCQSTQNVSLTVNPIPNVTATKAKSTVCVYDPNTTITAAGATSYSWSTGDLTATAIISPTISTTYTVTGTDLNGCSKTVTVTQFVAACLGIENYSGQTVQMSIYPNPNNGNFTISTDVAMRVNIVNTLGEVVKTVDLSTANTNEISMSNLANGIYFITGQNNGLKVNKKIVVQQ